MKAMQGKEHLTKTEQYALVYNEGRSWVSDLVVMKALPNGLALSRYGISVSKRVGNAVTRNRVKRLLREILRITQLEPGWDMVFMVRPAAADVDYQTLKRRVEGLLARAHLLATDKEPARLTGVKTGSGG